MEAVYINGGNDNVSYWLIQNQGDEYLIRTELCSGCNTKEDISRRIDELQKEYAARRYVIMGYDKDSDRLFQMQAADTLSEAAILARKVWEIDNQRTDLDREHKGVPDLDWFELYEQESGKIDYSKRLAVFYGSIDFEVSFDDSIPNVIRGEIEEALKQNIVSNPSFKSEHRKAQNGKPKANEMEI